MGQWCGSVWTEPHPIWPLAKNSVDSHFQKESVSNQICLRCERSQSSKMCHLLSSSVTPGSSHQTLLINSGIHFKGYWPFKTKPENSFLVQTFFLTCWYFSGGYFTCSAPDVSPHVCTRYIWQGAFVLQATEWANDASVCSIFSTDCILCSTLHPVPRQTTPLLFSSPSPQLVLHFDCAFRSPLASSPTSLFFIFLLYRYKVFLWFTAFE